MDDKEQRADEDLRLGRYRDFNTIKELETDLVTRHELCNKLSKALFDERAKVLEEIEENSLPVTLTISKDGKTYGNSPTGKPHRLIAADDWEKLKQGKPLDEEVKR